MDFKENQYGKVSIRAAFDSTFVLITGNDDRTVAWTRLNTRKPLLPETQVSADAAAEAAAAQGIKSVEVCVKGHGYGRMIALQALQNAGIEITLIKDETPIPHNGCRPSKSHRKG